MMITFMIMIVIINYNSSDDNDTKNIDINNKRNFENGKKEGEKDVEDEVVEKPYQVITNLFIY